MIKLLWGEKNVISISLYQYIVGVVTFFWHFGINILVSYKSSSFFNLCDIKYNEPQYFLPTLTFQPIVVGVKGVLCTFFHPDLDALILQTINM